MNASTPSARDKFEDAHQTEAPKRRSEGAIAVEVETAWTQIWLPPSYTVSLGSSSCCLHFLQSWVSDYVTAIILLVTLAPREECEDTAFGSVCLSVCLFGRETKQNYWSDLLDCFTQEVLCPCLGPSLRLSG